MPEKSIVYWYSQNYPWLNDFFNMSQWYSQSTIEVATSIDLVSDGSPSATDLENSIKIYNALRDKITEVQATDERLWTYFCHETFWEYMRWRWPVTQSSIQWRYFVNGNSSRALARNGIARLWWFAHLTYDQNRCNPYELTEVFLRHQDIQHNLIERNFGRSPEVLRATLEFLKAHPEVAGKDAYVKLGKILNRWGGVCVLDCLKTKEIVAYLEAKFSESA